MEQALRQQSYEVHRDTQSIVMLFCDEEWPASGGIYEESGHDRLADVAQPIIDHIINTWYTPGGLVIRAIAAKLVSGGKIPAHRDSIDSFHIGHRIHVPITTNPGVRFTIAGKPYPFDVGYAYEINNQQKHSVMNLGEVVAADLLSAQWPVVAQEAERFVNTGVGLCTHVASAGTLSGGT